MKTTRRTALKVTAAGLGALALKARSLSAQEAAQPFGQEFPNLESLTTGEWWTKGDAPKAAPKAKAKAGQLPPPPLDVPRDQVIAFALYTHQHGVLKLTAQLFPLKPGEARTARLEFQRAGRTYRKIRKYTTVLKSNDQRVIVIKKSVNKTAS